MVMVGVVVAEVEADLRVGRCRARCAGVCWRRGGGRGGGRFGCGGGSRWCCGRVGGSAAAVGERTFCWRICAFCGAGTRWR